MAISDLVHEIGWVLCYELVTNCSALSTCARINCYVV